MRHKATELDPDTVAADPSNSLELGLISLSVAEIRGERRQTGQSSELTGDSARLDILDIGDIRVVPSPILDRLAHAKKGHGCLYGF